jgi:hypothetical protein
MTEMPPLAATDQPADEHTVDQLREQARRTGGATNHSGLHDRLEAASPRPMRTGRVESRIPRSRARLLAAMAAEPRMAGVRREYPAAPIARARPERWQSTRTRRTPATAFPA